MSIICGTDLSPASSSALGVAVALANRQRNRELILVHVASEDASDSVIEAARHALVAQADAARATAGECAIRSELVVGPADEALVQFADTEASDLIVIAARSSRASTHVLSPDRPPIGRLGTTTSQIVARTHVPVIAIRDPEPWLAFARGERPLRVLLGIDDSAVCDLGIQWTHALRALGSVDVVLGAIYYPDDACAHYGLGRKGIVDRHPEIERLMARDLLRRFGGGDLQGVEAKPRRGLGRLGDHVVELAQEAAVDAIVVGTGQKTGLGRLGSVSSIIVNDAPQSVICVPPQAQVPTIVVPVLRAALVATDLSQFSNRAIPYAFAACEPDAEIHIVHIVDEDKQVDVDEVTRTLYRLAPVSAKQKVTAHLVRGDDAAQTVAQTAARLGVDVICICSHGRSGLSRALMGSVADRLLRETRLPVLVLRPA